MITNSWKRSAAWVTDLRSNIFVWARIKLTLLYVLVIMLILGAFSILFYYAILQAIQTNVIQTFMDPIFQTIIIQNMGQRTRSLILVGDAVILTVAAVTSYFLAGKTLHPIKDTMQRQQQFAANASHELRTPLTILKTDIEVTLRQIDLQPHLMRPLLESNLEEVNRLARLAEQLLLLLKRENSLDQQVYELLVLSDIARHMIQKMRGVAEHGQVSLHLGQAQPGYLLGNREQLEAVILNLIQNAVDHTPAGGKIQVNVIAQNRSLRLSIQDSGQGIPSEDLPFIFERFYKAGKTRDYTTGGAGLGLSIVREIVQRHHGNIQIDSAQGQGTSVQIDFPQTV